MTQTAVRLRPAWRANKGVAAPRADDGLEPAVTDERPKIDRELLGELARGARLIFENAEALFKEATTLAAAGATSRGLFLHQISLEECAKIDLIGPWATCLLAGIPTTDNNWLAAMRQHAIKNLTNAYMLEGSAEEQDAKQRGDWDVARAAFEKLQSEFHAKSNAAKNASLYVDFADGKFVSPVDRISTEMLTETAARNEMFLGLVYPKVEVLSIWAQDPDDASDRAAAMFELLNTTNDGGFEDRMAAVNRLMDELLTEARKKGERRD